MSTPNKTSFNLSPARRELLEKLMRKEGLNAVNGGITRRKERQRIPLSYGQQRLWFIDQLQGGSHFYNVPLAFSLSGPLDVDAVRRAVSEIVHRHEALRTTFQPVDDNVYQHISTSFTLSWSHQDLSSIPPDRRNDVALTLLEEDARLPFDLTAAPLLRTTLVKLSDTEHLLLLTIHHIAFDGWSTGILIREFSVLYDAFARGNASPLPELKIQYADYAIWQTESLQGDAFEQQLQFWREQLSEAHDLALTPDHARRAVAGFAGARVRFVLEPSLTAALKQLSRREDATLFMTLLAAFEVLLGRYSAQDQFIVGTATANRSRPETEDLIGFFVNMLPAIADLKGAPTFRQLLARVRESSIASQAHEEVPFDRLVEELQVDRDWSRNPLFQVAFAFQNSPLPEMCLGDLKLRMIDVDSASTPFDLVLSMCEEGGALHGWLLYRTELFDAGRMQRMARHYEQVLRAIVENVEIPVWAVSFLSKGEREQLDQSNRTARAFPRESSIAEQFESQVIQRPDAEAVVYGSERLSYRELNERANRLAHYLKGQGVGPEVVVGVSQERSVDLIVSLLGVLKAGGAYLPLDPEYPESRREYMAAQAGAKLVLSELPDLAECSTENLERQSGGDNLAYVMYTSGSTGRPKGIAVTQANVLRLVHEPQYVRLDHETVMLQLASNAFDAATFEIWGALLQGARLVLFPGRLASGAELQQLIAAEGVETLWLTSALYNGLVESGVEALAGVKQLLVGGEALSVKHIQQGLAALPETEFINGYGPTEVTTFSCTHRVRQTAAESWDRGVPIGRPINNTEAFVLDERGQLLPVGVVGELYLGGEGLARGYVGDAAQTAEKFVPHAFAKRAGARLYRTGDLARWRADGELEFVGRVDEQVKLRGYRIEPGEIEQALKEHEAVQDAVVVVGGDGDEEKRLVAYIVADTAAVTISELRAHLRERLPEYMAPWNFEYLDQLPLNANGKLDREALPKPHRPASARGFVSPRTDVEKQVAAICTEILGIKEPGVFDNLFALGCNSIKATVIVSRLRTTFGTALPLQSFFEGPTIEELTIAIAKSQLEQISNQERAALLAQLESLTLEELRLTLDNSNGSNSIIDERGHQERKDNENSFRQHAIRGGYAALNRADATEIDSPG